MKRKYESHKEIKVSLSKKAQKCLREYMRYTGQKNEAKAIHRMILRLADVMSNWHSETIGGKTVSVSPKGKVFYGTAKEVRDNLIDVSCRKTLALDLLSFHKEYMRKWIDRKTLFQWSTQSRREAIIRQDFTDQKDIVPKLRKLPKCNHLPCACYDEKSEGVFTTNPME